MNTFQTVFEQQKRHFASGVTRSYEWRVERDFNVVANSYSNGTALITGSSTHLRRRDQRRLPTTIDGFVAKHREAFVGTARQRHTNGVVGPHSNPPCSQGQGDRMKDLLTRVLDAHGGLSRWREIEA